ncbi:hypothetical protein V8B97DRAFT_1391815 [Scleroderma yunnanense]
MNTWITMWSPVCIFWGSVLGSTLEVAWCCLLEINIIVVRAVHGAHYQRASQTRRHSNRQDHQAKQLFFEEADACQLL